MTNRNEPWLYKAHREALKAATKVFISASLKMLAYLFTFYLFDWLVYDHQLIQSIAGFGSRTLSCIIG